jgi:hypothetical protein
LTISTRAGQSTPPALTLIHSPAPTTTFIPAPTVVVRRRVNGAEMGTFAAPAAALADKVARRWQGSVELVPGGARPQ